MKLILPSLFILSLLFSGCKHSSNGAQDGSSQENADIEAENSPDAIMLRQPIVSSVKHYFSDSTAMDSFVVEMPAGNILKNDMSVRIYNNRNELLFKDTVSASDFIEDAVYNQESPEPEVALSDLRRGIKDIFKGEVFTAAGKEGAIKDATIKHIVNKDTWNEAVDDSTKIIFTFSDSFRGTSYVAYSQKLKKAVVIVREPADSEE